MLHTVLSASEPASSEPALPEGSINLPTIAPNPLPATATDESLTEQLIRLLATSYVRNDTHFYHVDRPSEAMSRDNLQRAFLYQAAALNGGHEVPRLRVSRDCGQ